MHPNLTVPDVHASNSDAGLRRVLGGMSIFTMLMTIPQVFTNGLVIKRLAFLS
ncbi:MAG TPA: hypothetical protein VE616_25115 [Candidatus Udaeobacter sp.]|jgi:hypothetical protein|nr:hypothetical protein [Candidatus Udaeobacter sp.]